MITINTPTLSFILRPWQLSDAASLAKNANNKKIADNMRDMFPHPYLEANAVTFINSVMKDDPLKVFAIVVDNEACGGIGVFPQSDIHRLNAEMGYWLAEKHWGKGIITHAAREMIKYAFDTWPVIQRIYATPFVENIGSQRVMEKIGMKLEALIKKSIIKNNRTMDEMIYAVRRS